MQYEHPSKGPPDANRTGRTGLHQEGISRFDLRDPYHVAVTLSWPQFLAALLGLYLAVKPGVRHALHHRAWRHHQRPARQFHRCVLFSFETLATVGYGEMYPGGLYGHIVSCAEIVCGLAFTAILMGLTFVRFSRPRAKFVFADNPVVSMHNGQPTLMVRVGNGRAGVPERCARQAERAAARHFGGR